MYSKVIAPLALYGSELWRNLNNADIAAISRFQDRAVKQLQGLPVCTRFDMPETMVRLNRLPQKQNHEIFLHKKNNFPTGGISVEGTLYLKTYFS